MQSRAFGAEAYLRDKNGGECSISYGPSGTIDRASGRTYELERRRNYVTVSPGSNTRQTIVFPRSGCNPALTDRTSLVATIVTLVWEDEAPRALALTFDELPYVHRF
jgi:hypothetical protein